MQRGEIWLADLDPIKGSEQAGVRPVIIFQNNTLNQLTTTVICIPLTTSLRRAKLPSSLQIPKSENGLNHDSVALCHQIRVLDGMRLKRRLGVIDSKTLELLEPRILFTLGIGIK